MMKYVLRRLLIAVPTLMLISIVNYGILAFAPGDPLARFDGGAEIPPEVRANIRKQFGLDDPIYLRYIKWASSFVKGDDAVGGRKRLSPGAAHCYSAGRQLCGAPVFLV